MQFPYWTWVRHFWSQLVCIFGKQGHIESIPDDLIFDIFSKLPANDVMECREVCRKWRALTSSHEFIKKHLERAGPFLFLQYSSQTESDFHCVDEKYTVAKSLMKRACNRFMDTTPPLVLVDSCDGLVLFRDAFVDSQTFFICNPILEQVVTLKKPYPGGSVFGMFYHPWTDEYRLLYSRGNDELFIHSLGSKSWRRLDSTFGSKASSLPSVTTDNFIYWMVEPNTTHCNNSIIVFNIESEELKALPHPGSKCFLPLCDKTMTLTKFERNGLALGHIPAGHRLLIWVLKDHEKWSWDQMYEVDVWDLSLALGYVASFCKSEIVNIQNNELLIVLFSDDGGTIIRYDLQNEIVSKIGLKKYEDFHKWKVKVSNYTFSLVSLKNIYEGYGQSIQI